MFLGEPILDIDQGIFPHLFCLTYEWRKLDNSLITAKWRVQMLASSGYPLGWFFYNLLYFLRKSSDVSMKASRDSWGIHVFATFQP